MPATCRCHASTCRPSSGYSNYLPPPLQLPSPLSPGNINRRAYYTMRCVPGSMEELPLSSCSLVLLSPTMLWVPLLPLPLPLHSSHKTCSDVFGFLSLCLHLLHGAADWERGGTKLFMLHLSCFCTAGGRPEWGGQAVRYCLKLYRECIRVNPPPSSCAALYVSCLQKHSNCLPYERRRTWKAKRKL